MSSESKNTARNKVYLYCFLGCGVSDIYALKGSLFHGGFQPEGRSFAGADVEAYIPPSDLDDALFVGIFGLTMAVNVQNGINLAEKIRKAAPNALIVGGGEYPTHDAESMFRSSPLDIVILGDADATVIELATALQQGDSAKDIPGLAIRQSDGTILKTPHRPYEKNLDVFQYDFSNVDFSDAIQNGLCIGPISTSRGCPTHCTYCPVAMNRKAPWRSYSAERVLEFYKYLHERYNIIDFHPGDANFFVKKDRAIRILHGFKALGLRPLCLDAHARHMDGETFRAAHEAGVQIIFLGLETCNPETLKRIRKRRTHEDFVTCLKLAAEHAPGMTVAGTIMMAYPFQSFDELLQDVEDTFNLHEQFPHLSASFTCILPVLGSPMLQEMREAGYNPKNLHDIASITISSGFSTAGQWCAYARTPVGQQALWYITYVINYLVRYPAYGWLDKIVQKVFKRIARWRLSKRCFALMQLDYGILRMGEVIVNSLRKQHKLSDVKVGDHA